MEETFVSSPKEIKSSSDSVFPTILDQCIKKIINKEGFLKCEINKRCASLDGNNYLSNLYEIDLKGRTEEGDKELNLFMKHIVQLEIFIFISVPDLFKSELFAYKELSKIFTALQNEANVPLENRFKMAKIYEESNTEVIIMENLAKNGFTTWFRMDVMPLEFAKRSIEQLARFHALSFVLREKRPEYFESKIKSIKHPHTFNDQWRELIKSSKETALDNVDEEYKDKLAEAFKYFMDEYPKYCNDETIKACLCHGDYKLNNIMVKIDKGEIEDLIPIDFQHIHYGCPVFDLLFFIYVGSDREFRKAHMLNLKNHYYESFSNFMKYFNLDADKIYPRNDFEKVYKEKLDYGALIMIVFLPFLFAAQNHAPDVTKRQSNISIKVDDRYKDRLMGLIEDYIEINCI